MNIPKEREASAYVGRIRNRAKKAYAIAYWQFLKSDAPIQKAPTPECSYMAAQAVRFELDCIHSS